MSQSKSIIIENSKSASETLEVTTSSIICLHSSADQQYDTIVVGLGAAGTAAFSKLARAGRRVLGLEAADRVGGRVKTIPFGDGIVEFGAEWFVSLFLLSKYYYSEIS